MIKLSKEPLIVTDHACLRYLQRHHGIDMELIRSHIFDICSTAAAFGATAVRAEGVKFEIVNGRVVTVVPDDTEPSKMSRQRSSAKVRA